MHTGLEISPTDSRILYRVGLAHYANGDLKHGEERYKEFKLAIKILKLALQHSPLPSCISDIYYHVGLSYCFLQKYEKSIFPFSKSIELQSSDMRYYHERAKAYQMIENHEEALSDFNEVIKRNPKNANAYFRRAFSAKALRMYGEAAEDFEKAKELDPLNPKIVVNYKKLQGISCIVLCKPGQEKVFS